MKKNRFFLSIIIVAMMLMGSGYAAWSQSFSVKNVVNTGELSFTVDSQNVKHDQYTSVDIKSDHQSTFDVLITDAYPGAEYTYDILVKNTGTMALAFEKIKDQYLKEDMELIYNFSEAMIIEPNQEAIIPVKLIAGDKIPQKCKVGFSQSIQYSQFNDPKPAPPNKPVDRFDVKLKPGGGEYFDVAIVIYNSKGHMACIDQQNLGKSLTITIPFYRTAYENGTYRVCTKTYGSPAMNHYVTVDFDNGTYTVK